MKYSRTSIWPGNFESEQSFQVYLEEECSEHGDAVSQFQTDLIRYIGL